MGVRKAALLALLWILIRMIRMFLDPLDPDLSLLVWTRYYLYGFGSGSFHHEANKVRKILISNVL
jgi:hypothetical protein